MDGEPCVPSRQCLQCHCCHSMPLSWPCLQLHWKKESNQKAVHRRIVCGQHQSPHQRKMASCWFYTVENYKARRNKPRIWDLILSSLHAHTPIPLCAYHSIILPLFKTGISKHLESEYVAQAVVALWSSCLHSAVLGLPACATWPLLPPSMLPVLNHASYPCILHCLLMDFIPWVFNGPCHEFHLGFNRFLYIPSSL